MQIYLPHHMHIRSPFTEDLLELLRNSSYAVLAQSFAATYFSWSRIFFFVPGHVQLPSYTGLNLLN